jgi:hypothetical protein
LVSDSCSQNRPLVQVPERRKAEQARLQEFATRHNAAGDWVESLPNRGNGSVFTVDLTKALVRTNGQPVAMVAFLEDLSEKDGVFTGHFTMFDLSHRQLSDPRLDFRCSAQQVEDLLKSKPDDLGMRFLIAATVESVSRPAFEVIATEGGDASHIDFSDMPEAFFAKGNLVAAEPFGRMTDEEVSSFKNRQALAHKE